jgi:hypothetical protein
MLCYLRILLFNFIPVSRMNRQNTEDATGEFSPASNPA